MCGLVGVLEADGRGVDPAVLMRMRGALTHRGPNDEGLWTDGGAGLAHTRLSILDLSPAGHQPMTNEDDTLWLVFNGEIYNSPALRRELLARGHRFHSETDSEVILHLYEEEGKRCVERMRGMFAFVIYDTRTRTFFGARDRLGIKPLYYRFRGNAFDCASEVKALLAHPAADRTDDPQGLADLLFCGRPLAGRTLLRDIREVPPGCRFHSDGRELRIEPYWKLTFDYRHGRSFDQLADELAERLQEAVEMHCLSDAPLGSHLSGGLDSSTVASLAALVRPRPLDTFAIRFEGGAYYDESRYSAATAGHAGARLHLGRPDSGLIERIYPRLLWHLDYPVSGDPGFTYACAARLAADHVTVSLTGHGGDELFGGYPAQFWTSFGHTAGFAPSGGSAASARAGWWQRLRSLRRRVTGGIARRLRRRGTSAYAELTNAERQWMRLHTGLEPAADPTLSPRFLQRLEGYSPVDDYLHHFRNAETDEVFDRCTHHDLRNYLPELLHKEDRASMAVALESRVPLLDHELIEFVATIPPELRVRNQEPKALLRAAARRWLPAEVVERRDKSPFPVPMSQWLDGDLGAILRGMLREQRTLDRGVFRREALDDCDRDTLLQMTNIELWYRIFIDGEDDRPNLPPSGDWWLGPPKVIEPPRPGMSSQPEQRRSV